ncbi:hypothetical protein O3M35_012263 [Rhynocoris fuscipes]|uniref:Uncharacterized protein n=1 Tax=Rhynocoris fuscipes TaxID=488301 RepID=A0AAW1CUB1_9HEMI
MAMFALVLICFTIILTSIVVPSEQYEVGNTEHQQQRTHNLNEDFQLDETVEGRKVKQKMKGKIITYIILAVKLLGATIMLPTLLALALFASWKGITISLLAFMVATIVGIKNLAASKTSSNKGTTQHVIVAKLPSQSHHEHFWNRIGEDWQYPGAQFPEHEYLRRLSPYHGYSKR